MIAVIILPCFNYSFFIRSGVVLNGSVVLSNAVVFNIKINGSVGGQLERKRLQSTVKMNKVKMNVLSQKVLVVFIFFVHSI